MSKKDFDPLEFIPTKKEKKYPLWLLFLVISTIAILIFAIWAKLDCPGGERLFGLNSNVPLSNQPKIPLETKPETFYNKHPEPQGTKVVSGTMTDYRYDQNTGILYIKVRTKDNYIWLLKHQNLSRVINQEEGRSYILNTRDTETWIHNRYNRGIAVTAGIKNNKVEDVIMLVPLD
jgi:hypothetical protein